MMLCDDDYAEYYDVDDNGYAKEPDIEAAFAKIREEHGCVVKSKEAITNHHHHDKS